MIRVRNEKKGGILIKRKVSQGELDRRRDIGREIRHPIERERQRDRERENENEVVLVVFWRV